MTQLIASDLVQLFEQQYFSNLDYYFARHTARIFKETDPIVLFSCAQVSKVLFQGHICLDINKMAGHNLPADETGEFHVRMPEKQAWLDALGASEMVSDKIETPLVLDSENRLFLSKYYDLQVRLAENIAARHVQVPFSVDVDKIERLVEEGFNTKDPHVLPQKKAVIHALKNQFTVISGGPGTGKTFVSRQIRQILFQLNAAAGLKPPSILSVAPTGKAASKMEQGRTIHSVLKPYRQRPGFRHNRDNPLTADMVIIDESSMIDIILLTRLLEAIPSNARVILLGDRHQLASVQAGSVFADICSAGVLDGSTFVLEYNFRSGGKSGIENLANAINKNDIPRVEQILTGNAYPDIAFENWGEDDENQAMISKLILSGYRDFISAGSMAAALEKLDAFRILCAHNSGRYGTLQINHLCENILRSASNSDIQGDHFKRVIMVNANDYKKGLFNGDTGIIIEENGEAAAYMADQDNTVKRYRAGDLPDHDTAFAITIHKSQGSEFESVLILLPEKISPVLTRQLLYTGVTRAKEKVAITGGIDIIREAIGLAVEHDSGFVSCLETCIDNRRKTIKKDN